MGVTLMNDLTSGGFTGGTVGTVVPPFKKKVEG